MRILHKLYARLAGYFWKPCALCGCEFGGHELNDETEYIKLPGRENEQAVCGSCSKIVRVINIMRLLPPTDRVRVPFCTAVGLVDNPGVMTVADAPKVWLDLRDRPPKYQWHEIDGKWQKVRMNNEN